MTVCTVCIYIYGQHFYQSMDRPGMVANPTRGQLNREIVLYISPFEPEKLVTRGGFDRPVPRQPAHSPHSG